MRYDSDGWIFLGYFWWGNGGLVRLALASHISFFFSSFSFGLAGSPRERQRGI